ncbi:glycosyltransferase family 4 protein [Anaerolineae bacterium CFX9]|nr:glycosyltransferase family 4 protein [Anaerolineae bacterium CFX9]
MSTLRIGIDARLTYYRVGGISTYIARLVDAIERLQDSTIDLTVFHSRKMPRDKRIGSRSRHASLWTPSHHRLERWSLSAELLPHRLDVFHSTDFIPPLRGGRRHVISVHDLNFLLYPQFLTAESRRYYNDQIRFAVRRADHILTISQSSKQDIMALLDVPGEKITVTLLAADERFRPLDEDTLSSAREALRLPEGYLLYFGTFEPRKNLLGLAQGYAELLRRLPDAPPLIIAGKRGWLFEDIQTKIEALGLGEKILLREDIPHDHLPALYNLATALLMPSYYEGFGLPALEAMACGTVPIVSNRSSLPEVVGDVGLMVDPDDPRAIAAAMERALTDAPWREAQAKQAIRRAAGFTWESVARSTLNVYRAVS